MSEKKPRTITIEDTEYTEDQLTDEQLMLVHHVSDLERKMASTQFNLDQLQGGWEHFMGLLRESLAESDKAE